MDLTRTQPPEMLYGDTMAKVDGFVALSRQYAEQGQVVLAVHALWAADVHAVQALMWERVLAADPRPDERFFVIATNVSRALAHYAVSNHDVQDARSAVESARAGLANAFDEQAMQALALMLPDISHLDGLPHPTTADLAAPAETRLEGASVADVAAARRVTARDCMVVAVAMDAQGHHEDAMAHAWQADWAEFEAYLLEAAQAVGDDRLITVEMRWALACQALAAVPGLPADLPGAVGVVRAVMTSVLGPIEGDRLAGRFAPLS